jgi:hypothetical protein
MLPQKDQRDGKLDILINNAPRATNRILTCFEYLICWRNGEDG